ncbi:hypothetical protein HNP84_002311 [Thermocatellispora tengchongensis]|uniref:Uncharacterized protein n=1 Tax=Thermocatellispora tengchongensis TaxID=1073253 RepID=A0A840P9C9_9ACTN|nr:hypothetical protein [Thermocatellispora tengchongensis]MBB5132595.1 hypothetical protein [Thermocatellispora tengchongensis]
MAAVEEETLAEMSAEASVVVPPTRFEPVASPYLARIRVRVIRVRNAAGTADDRYRVEYWLANESTSSTSQAWAKFRYKVRGRWKKSGALKSRDRTPSMKSIDGGALTGMTELEVWVSAGNLRRAFSPERYQDVWG